MQIPIAGKSSNRQAGFTLVETALVVFIISLFAFYALPRLADVGALKLNGNALKVARTISYLYTQASASNRLLRFTIDTQTGEYSAALQNDEGTFERETFALFTGGRLANGVHVVSFRALFNPSFEGKRTAYLHLLPGGLAERAVIVLGDAQGRLRSLVVHPLTGKVAVKDGAVAWEYTEREA